MSQRSKPTLGTWQDLIGQAATEDAERPLKGARLVRLDLIDANPAQARQSFDETALAELAESIRTQGVIQPVVLRRTGERYQIVAGERRTRAARAVGLEAIPAIIREYTDEQAAVVTAIENLQRQDLDIEDEARQYQALLDLTGLSQRDLARHLGIDHNYLSRRVRLLRRPDLLQAYRDGRRGLLETVSLVDAPADAPGVSQRHTDPAPVERAVLDAAAETEPAPVSQRHSAPDLGGLSGDAPAPPIITLPWRRRPLDEFGTWLARTPPAVVPPKERPEVRRQLAEIRAWINRFEDELRGDEDAD